MVTFFKKHARNKDASSKSMQKFMDALGADKQVTLHPLVKRHELDLMPAGSDIRFGWAQLPSAQQQGFSLGVFLDTNHFVPIAFADGNGRVFVGNSETVDPYTSEARLIFTMDGKLELPDGPRFGHAPQNSGRKLRVIRGSISVRGADGTMMWIASWLKAKNKYTLEQMRMPLPEHLRIGLEYRDAMAVAFFAGYIMPQAQGLLTGFGSGNIFRRLNREAPLGAIRRSVQDTLEARSHGLRTSGLEDYFADLMGQCGALTTVDGLEAEHGAEPSHLWASSYSHTYFLSIDRPMPVDAALAVLKIENAINRFANVSAWLEHNALAGKQPIEDTVTRAQAAQIDRMLLDNPALLAFDDGSQTFNALENLLDGDGYKAVNDLVSVAGDVTRELAKREHMDAHKPGEWLYRYSLSTLIRRLRLPYRFEADFRCNVEAGNAALEFMTAGMDMMPQTQYSDATHGWETLSDHERATLSVRYNLRVAIILAALAFGADPNMRTLSIDMGSIGLEEAVAEQDDAIKRMANEMIRDVDQLRFDADAISMADSKDGDYHGDPSDAHALPVPGDDLAAGDRDVNQDHVDSEFEALMDGVDIDETVLSTDNLDDTFAGGPQDALPDMIHPRSMMTVRLERDSFLRRLREDGLAHPLETMVKFDAVMNIDADQGFLPITASFDINDGQFSPANAQRKPEMDNRPLEGEAAAVFGARNVLNLSIQRDDLLTGAVREFHSLALRDDMSSADKAHRAMALIDLINDPELNMMASEVTSALIDGDDTPDLSFTLGSHLDDERVKARELLFSGQVDQAIQTAQDAIQSLDDTYRAAGVPRYFNSYAERVVYNRVFATPDERITLIPDNLFHAHFELADLLAQTKGPQAALAHLNTMVSYAPAYPLSHLKLAVQFARTEDWDSARAACLNALRVSLDGKDASFAYYRLAQALWMRDEFDVAIASYMMAADISPAPIPSLQNELQELIGRAQSQCVPYPRTMDEAVQVLARHDIPIWPVPEISHIVHEAARMSVNEGLFVPARTLVVASARLGNTSGNGVDFVHDQLLRSLMGPEDANQQ